jgi:uncharacterized protein (TIGR02391 family)
MRAAIPILERRLQELEALKPNTATSLRDAAFTQAQLKLEDTLIDIFGNDTIEYHRFHIDDLYYGGYRIGGLDAREIVEGLTRGRADAITKVQTIIGIFKEKLGNLGESAVARAMRTVTDLDLHPEIRRAAGELFRNGHYANAVEDACKALDGLVKLRSGRFDIGGTDLMTTVFSPKNPVLRFNDLATDSDRSEQQGMMQLFAGAMLAFRNPRAHEIVTDDPERALEILSFLSFLAKAADSARR